MGLADALAVGPNGSAVLLFPALVLACVGLLLLVAAGAGGVLWLVGAGLPLVLAVLVVGLMVQGSRHRRGIAARRSSQQAEDRRR